MVSISFTNSELHELKGLIYSHGRAYQRFLFERNERERQLAFDRVMQKVL